VVFALIIWRRTQIGGCSKTLLEFRVGRTQKTTLKDLIKSCILEILFLFFILSNYIDKTH
jgi:hypothetical protein